MDGTNTSCRSCGRNGFNWKKAACFYCGVIDESRDLQIRNSLQSERDDMTLLSGRGFSQLPNPVAREIKCQECGREGFAWNRSYCSYCGKPSEELNGLNLEKDRVVNDKLYDEALKYSKCLRRGDAALFHGDVVDGGFSSSFSGDALGGADCSDSFGSCSD